MKNTREKIHNYQIIDGYSICAKCDPNHHEPFVLKRGTDQEMINKYGVLGSMPAQSWMISEIQIKINELNDRIDRLEEKE